MARRSRADMEQERKEREAQDTQERIFSTGIYARLSVENSGKSSDRDVISAQIECCKEFIRENPDLSLTEIYVDNGATGTNFKRSGFEKMMKDVESGKIECLIVRDLSRFGRNHLETGAYLEKIFPEIGLRFISISERYDNFSENNLGAMLPLQNMINEMYAFDTSRKVSIALKSQMEKGTFRLRHLPYGYKWSENREEAIIDEEVAQYVKDIFKWRLEGMSISNILKQLEEQKAPVPSNRRYENGVLTGTSPDKKYWEKSSVSRILRNQFYTGDTALGKTESALYKGVAPRLVKDKEQWHIFENTHPAIISKEDFAEAQKISGKASATYQEKTLESESKRAKIIDLFSGKFFCADCGRKIHLKKNKILSKKGDNPEYIWRGYYNCSTYLSRAKPTCFAHHISQDELNEKVLSAIKSQVKVAMDYEALLKKLKNSTADKSVRDKQNSLISSLTLKLNTLKKKREGLYSDYSEGILDLDEYTYAKETYDNQYSALSTQLDEAQQRKKEFTEAMSSNNKWITLMKSVSKAKKLNQALVDTVIDKVILYPEKSLEIVFKFNDIFLLMDKSIKEVENEVA